MPAATMLRRAALASIAMTLALPAAAQGAITVGFDSPGGLLRITVTDASSDVTLAAGVGGMSTTVTATAPVTPGAGCIQGGANDVTCTPAGASVTFTGGAGPDTLRVTAPFTVPITATGGAGADQLSGGDGNDSLDTFDRAADTVVTCGGGADLLLADNFLDTLDVATCETIAPEFGAGDPSIIDEDPVPGATLTVTTSPTGTPSTLSFQWFSCDATGDLVSCLAIPGATGATLTLATGDIGRTMRIAVRAENAAGKDARISPPSAVVHAPPAAAPPPRRRRLPAPPPSAPTSPRRAAAPGPVVSPWR
jgi:hypothetical protein